MKTKITSLILFAFTALLAFTACSNSNEAPAVSLPDLTGTYTGTFENTSECAATYSADTIKLTIHGTPVLFSKVL